MQDEGYKRCSKCGETKPLDGFQGHRTTADGLRPECRRCVAQYQRDYRQRNAARLKAAKRAYGKRTQSQRRKPCDRCGGPKPAGERRRYCELCRVLAAEEQRQHKNVASKRWYRENFEVIAAKARAKQRDPEFARAAAERVKAWAEANPERWADHRRKHVTSYRAKQRDNFIEAVSHREVYDRASGICYLCGEPISLDVGWRDGLAFQVDHVVPVTRDGEHSYANVRATHRKCNRRKGARLLDP